MIRKAVICTSMLVFLLCQPVRANQNETTNNVTKVKESIVKHSLEIGVDPALALSIAKSESGFKHETKSCHGAVGVFQLMPSTAKILGVNPYYLSDNIRGGLMYYKKLYDMFGSTELALAAYNAGPGNVKKYNSVPPFKETKRFVSEIMAEYGLQKNTPDPAISKVKNEKEQEAKKLINTVSPVSTSSHVLPSLSLPDISVPNTKVENSGLTDKNSTKEKKKPVEKSAPLTTSQVPTYTIIKSLMTPALELETVAPVMTPQQGVI